MSASDIAASKALPAATAGAAAETPRYDARTRALIEGPIAATLIRLAAPNIAGDAGANFGRAGRDLFRRQARHRSARRRRAGLSRRDADADDVGRRHGRRHVVGDRARARRRTPRRRQCAWRCMRSIIALVFGLTFTLALLLGGPLALCGDGRQRRFARGRGDLFERHLRRRDPGLAVQFARQCDPRHRQYAVPGAGHHRRRRRAHSAVALPDLRFGTVAETRRRRRRGRGAASIMRREASCSRPICARTQRRLACNLPASGCAGRCSPTFCASARSRR